MPSVIISEFMPASIARRVSVATPSTETSPWVMVNTTATVVVKPTTTMKVQATCSLPSVVAADNANGTSNAAAFDWVAGVVSIITAEQVSNVTAVRFVAVSGAGVGEIGT